MQGSHHLIQMIDRSECIDFYVRRCADDVIIKLWLRTEVILQTCTSIDEKPENPKNVSFQVYLENFQFYRISDPT